jgi:hypothetical protein
VIPDDGIRGSTAPFDGEPPQGVDIRCSNRHESRIYLRGMTFEMAIDYARMLDGSAYPTDPRLDPTNKTIGICQICGAPFKCVPFGYVEN